MAAPIVTLTLNPALDVTYHLPALELEGSNRIADVDARAGGKGINVTRILMALDHPTRAVAPLGGTLGQRFEVECTRWGLPLHAVPISGSTRQTITIVEDSGRATVLNEPGPDLSEHEQTEVVRAVERVLEDASALIISGSLPGSTSADILVELIKMCRTRNRLSVVDTSGEALVMAAQAGADILKPNHHEVLLATGQTDVDTAVAVLLELGARRVVVSRADKGLISYQKESRIRADGVPTQHGNPTGAGDAVVAAVTLGAVRGIGSKDGLRLACAAGAAAVRQPVAGALNVSDVRELMTHVRIA